VNRDIYSYIRLLISTLDIERLLSSHLRAFSFPGRTALVISSCPHRGSVPCLGSLLKSCVVYLPPPLTITITGHYPTGLCLSCTEDSTSRCSTPCEVSPAQSRRAGSPPSPCWPLFFWRSPGYSWLSGLQGHTASSHPACNPPVSPGPFWQGCSLSLYPPACTDSGGFCDQGARVCSWLYWTSWGSPGPTTPVCLGHTVNVHRRYIKVNIGM